MLAGQEQIRFLLAGPDRKMLRLASGLTLKPDIAFDELPALDLLLLPAIWRNPRPTVLQSSSWRQLLIDHAETGAKLCSVGTGSCLLAEAGLLSGRPATTHWNYFEQFASRYPDTLLKSRHLITQSDNIYCVGSVNSIADLMVHIIEEWLGSRVARAVENQFSPEIRRAFGAAAYQNEADSSHHDETVVQAQQWLQDKLSQPITIHQLADRLGVGSRTLNRRFKQATGTKSPGLSAEPARSRCQGPTPSQQPDSGRNCLESGPAGCLLFFPTVPTPQWGFAPALSRGGARQTIRPWRTGRRLRKRSLYG